MLVRGAAIVVVALYLGSVAPRAIVGDMGWIVWLAAALLVLAGPRLAFAGMRRLVRSRRSS